MEVAIIGCLLTCSGMFAASEAAFFSLSLLQRERIKKNDSKRGAIIDKLLGDPQQLIVTILAGNDLVNIAASVVATFLFVSLLGRETGKWVTIAVMTPLTLIFAEVIPKTVSVPYNERVAGFMAGPISVFSKFILPLRWVFDSVADIFMRVMGIRQCKPVHVITEDDFLDMVDLSLDLKVTEKELIHNVFEFSDALVRDVMTPLEKMFCFPHDAKPESVFASLKETAFSRIPVYRGDLSNIVGILYAKDLLKTDSSRVKPGFLLKLCRRPVFINENLKVELLFYTLKRQRTHIAICLDSEGKVSGLVTLEDLLEELFGEIYDEYDQEEE